MEGAENRSERLIWKQRLGEFKAIYQSMSALYKERDWNKLDRIYRSIRIMNLNSNSNSNSNLNSLNNNNEYARRLNRAKNMYLEHQSRRRVSFPQGGRRTRRHKK
jgi:hypothetical protein